jgi:hypothetical protein
MRTVELQRDQVFPQIPLEALHRLRERLLVTQLRQEQDGRKDRGPP